MDRLLLRIKSQHCVFRVYAMRIDFCCSIVSRGVRKPVASPDLFSQKASMCKNNLFTQQAILLKKVCVALVKVNRSTEKSLQVPPRACKKTKSLTPHSLFFIELVQLVLLASNHTIFFDFSSRPRYRDKSLSARGKKLARTLTFYRTFKPPPTTTPTCRVRPPRLSGREISRQHAW